MSELSPTTPSTTAVVATKPSPIRNIFFGPNGLRAGWRIVIFILIVWVLSFLAHEIRVHFFPHPPRDLKAPSEPIPEIISRGLAFLLLCIASFIMAKIERVKMAVYGLPWRRAVSFEFWFGCLWGIGALTIVMAALWLAGAYRIESFALAGVAIWKYAALWAVMFLCVGLLEEYMFRGYLQYTLSSGIGFWPAAIVLSLLFLAAHMGNPGENPIGLADVFVAGMFLAFTLYRTGDLWFAVGMHAAWDWGLSYLYSVPDSGTEIVGHLFNIKVQGPTWLTGGSAGPEGSLINLISDILMFFIFALFYKRRKWIGMDDVRREHEAARIAVDTVPATSGD